MNESLYLILKSIHATAMSVAFILLLVRELLLLSAGYLQTAPRLYQWSSRIARVSEPLALGGLVAGIATALAGGWNLLTPWLVLAYILIILSLVVGGLLVKPWQKRLEALESASEGVTAGDLQPILRERRALAGRWLTVVILLSILVVMRVKPSFGTLPSVTAADPGQTAEISSAPTQAAQADGSYTLQTVMGGSPGLAFVGVGGVIGGVFNPTLTAVVGDVVTITLVNGHMMPHDLVIDGLGVATAKVSGAGERATISFTVTEAGEFSYYCSFPGHRQAGMAGVLRVSAS